MDSQDLRNLQEAYSSVYEATGRDEMIAANLARAKAAKTSSPAPKPTTPTTTTTPNSTGPVAQAPKPAGGLLGKLDTAARDTAGKVGEVVGRETAKGVPGANLPILGDVIKNEGGRRGRNQGQQMYDKAKETVGGFLKQDYEYDMFDIILEYLVAEGYADTNENALVIMANMSEEWRETIIEAQVLAAKGGVPGTMNVKPTKEGGFLGIGAKTVNKPVAGSFKPSDVSSTDAARYNTQVDRNNTIGRGTPPASVVQRRAKQSGHSGYMQVKNPDSIPNTGIPDRPTPQRAGDQNRARG